MPLTEKQTALKAYLTTGPAGSLPFLDEQDNNTTRTIAEWVGLGNTRAVWGAITSADIGFTLGITVPAGLVQTAEVKKAIGRGREWPAQVSDSTVTKLGFSIGDNALFDTADPDLIDNIRILLEEPYADCWAEFQKILTRSGSIAEKFEVSPADIDAICAPS